ncbi:tetratricopeptide repeat protein [Robiginitalea sp. IMCC43444]|uniref:tetratricopeptide repeat protein n=1 Tax=Robiginitalea sp. IMCC43444 TaxID=3459121 RepID=UPI0040424073
MKFKKFIAECRENDVFKNLSIYVVSAWVLLQVVDLIAEPLNLPGGTLTYLLIILLVGFPVYLYLLWRFELRHKVRKKPLKNADGDLVPGKFVKTGFQQLYFSILSIIGLLAISVVLLVIKQNNETITMPQNTLSEAEENDKIAVLTFNNNTADASLDIIGKMAVDWIMHGITENKLGQVISPKIVQDYSNILKASILPTGDNGVLKTYLKPSKVISGSYYLDKDRLLLQCSILDGNLNTTLISFEVTECKADSPLVCIEALKQEILGYFRSRGDTQILLEDTPPSFRAYQLWLEAEEALEQPNYLDLINAAIAADSSYFKPKLDRVLYYYNRDAFAVADSLVRVLSTEIGTNKQQLNMLKHLEACLKGDNKTAYRTYREEYNNAPMDLELNSSLMVLALQFVNRPQDVDPIFEAMDMKDMDLGNCIQCEYRYFIKGMSNIELGRAGETIALLEPFARSEGLEWIKRALLKAYVQAGETEAAKKVLEYVKLVGESDYWEQNMLVTGMEFLKVGNTAEANAYFDSLIRFYAEQPAPLKNYQKKIRAEAAFYKEDYAMAEKWYSQLLEETSLNASERAFLAATFFKNGKESSSSEQLQALKEQRSRYQFGDIDYALAQYYAISGEDKQSMEYLKKAVAAGKRFTNSTFQNDPIFMPYYKTAAFKEVLEFWYE